MAKTVNFTYSEVGGFNFPKKQTLDNADVVASNGRTVRLLSSDLSQRIVTSFVRHSPAEHIDGIPMAAYNSNTVASRVLVNKYGMLGFVEHARSISGCPSLSSTDLGYIGGTVHIPSSFFREFNPDINTKLIERILAKRVSLVGFTMDHVKESVVPTGVVHPYLLNDSYCWIDEKTFSPVLGSLSNSLPQVHYDLAYMMAGMDRDVEHILRM